MALTRKISVGSLASAVTFVYGVTQPQLVDPLNPTPADNVGWNGDSSGGVMTGDQTIPSGTTWSNRIINGYVTFTDATSVLTNSIIFGRTVGGGKVGYAIMPNGGKLNRVTIYGMPGNVFYATNGVSITGGVATIERSAIYRVVDCIHGSGSTVQIKAYGNIGGRYAFFDDDLDHASGTPNYWTHNDFIQKSSGSLPDDVIGNLVQSYFETAGVVWSGGSWGSGIASGGDIGAPATALNAGYWSAAGKGTWANGFTWSNAGGYTVNLEGNWVDGVNATSGLMQFVPSGASAGVGSAIRCVLNRFGLGGKPSGSGRFYLVSAPTSSTFDFNGLPSGGNTYDTLDSVPIGLQGQLLTFDAGGAKVTL